MPEALLLVDTDILIDYLRGNPLAVSFVQNHAERIILSSIVAAELYAGARNEKELATLGSLLSIFRVIPVSHEIAKRGGILKQEYAKSHGIGLADAIIAATAESVNAELKTLNTKHFPMFKNLRPTYTKA
jgi:predicted nucleic acid-binding protein